MIVDYELSPKYRPTERAIWLMSKSAENDGVEVTRSMMKAFEKGELKYIDHQLYKLCRHCMDYKPLDHFYASQRYIMGKGYICKDCLSIRRRIKKYGVVCHISDVGMQSESTDFGLNLEDEMKEILKGRLEDGKQTDR